MRIYFSFVLIICSFHSFVNGFAYPSDDGSSDSNSERDELVSKDGDGRCTFRTRKDVFVTVEVPYQEYETFYGRCRGYYFRKCINERLVQKTRYENRVQPKIEIVQKCCEGYASIGDSTQCIPICEHTCVHSNCTAPNTCTCYEGYLARQNETNVCEPDCVGCTYGKCVAPNLCQCDMGYDWHHEQSQCVPFCSGQCHNGDCIAPEQCRCNQGYFHHPNESFCLPECTNECINGICTEPDICECFSCYRFANGSGHECEPICEIYCINSKCVEPNTCECHSGYIAHNDSRPHECSCGKYCAEVDDYCRCLDENQRVSVHELLNDTICSRKNCVNGFCASPTECDCFEGFEKDENNVCSLVNEICIDDPKLCNGTEVQGCDCINGICSKDGVCICLNGFKMIEGQSDRCEPFCSKECVGSKGTVGKE